MGNCILKQKGFISTAFQGIIKQDGLIDAAFYGRINIVRKYLNNDSVDVNGRDDCGNTALYKACWKGHRDVAELLLDNGADIEERCYINDTPLMQASFYGHASTTKLLLDRGCAVNAIHKNGCTALHYACWRGFTECVKELLTHGGDTTIENKDGKTPFDLAKGRNHQAVIDTLIAYNKRVGQHFMDSNEDENKSGVDISKAEDAECASTLDQIKEQLLTGADAFLCPITTEPMKDPVICCDGHTYEREAIERWLRNNSRSPKTNQTLATKEVTPNYALRSSIEAFIDLKGLLDSQDS